MLPTQFIELNLSMNNIVSCIVIAALESRGNLEVVLPTLLKLYIHVYITSHVYTTAQVYTK